MFSVSSVSLPIGSSDYIKSSTDLLYDCGLLPLIHVLNWLHADSLSYWLLVAGVGFCYAGLHTHLLDASHCR